MPWVSELEWVGPSLCCVYGQDASRDFPLLVADASTLHIGGSSNSVAEVFGRGPLCAGCCWQSWRLGRKDEKRTLLFIAGSPGEAGRK